MFIEIISLQCNNIYIYISLAPQPSLGLGLPRNLLPLKMAEFLGGFSTIFFFTEEGC
jgi:hypothetical protein